MIHPLPIAGAGAPSLTPQEIKELQHRCDLKEAILCKAMPGNSQERRRLQAEYIMMKELLELAYV